MALTKKEINFEVGVKMQMSLDAMKKAQFDEDLIFDVLQGQKAYNERLSPEALAKIRFINKGNFHTILNSLIGSSPCLASKAPEKQEGIEKKGLKEQDQLKTKTTEKEQTKTAEYDEDVLIMQKLLAKRTEKFKSKVLPGISDSEPALLFARAGGTQSRSLLLEGYSGHIAETLLEGSLLSDTHPSVSAPFTPLMLAATDSSNGSSPGLVLESGLKAKSKFV